MYLTGINVGLPAVALVKAGWPTNCLASANGSSFAKAPAVKEKFCGLSTRKFKQTLRIMRLIIFLMLTGLLQVSASGTGQTISLSVRNTPIELVFKKIEQQSGYAFVYFKKDLEKIGRITLLLSGEPLTSALDKCFENLPFSYIIDEKNIIVMAKQSAITKGLHTEAALLPPYSGIIRDASGVPIPGVNIQVKGTQQGVVTDAEGRFTIEAAAGATLVISSVGYQTREIKLGNDTDIAVVLNIKTSVIDTAVVNYVSTGYQYIARERATGAFSQVTSADLDKQIGVTNIRDKFKHLLPGVLVDGGTMMVRGKGSLYAGTEPLLVIDGFATSLDLSTINPNDVESITVLRDAAAASIWGARASNGVIVIVTKRGRNVNGKPTVSVTNTMQFTNAPDLKHLKLTNASQMVDLELDALSRNWYSLTSGDNNQGYSRVYEIYRKRSRGEITQEEANRQYDVLRNNNAFAQDDLFFQTGITQQYNVAVSGATPTNRFYVSFNYTNTRPNSRRNNGNNYTLFAKNSYQFHPKIRFDADINLSYNKSTLNGVSIGEFVNQKPYEPYVDKDGKYVTVYEANLRTVETNQAWQQKGWYDWSKNLKRDFDNFDRSSSSFSPRINLGLNYDIIKGLSIETKLQHERNDYRYDNYENEEMYSTRTLINLFTVQQSDGMLKYGVPRGTIYKANTTISQSTTWRNQLRFDREWDGTRHRVSAIAGTELNRNLNKSRNERYHNYSKQLLTYATINEENLTRGIAGYDGRVWTYPLPFKPVDEAESRYFSMFFNGAYTFDNKYTVSVSGRMDKSNLFGAATNDKITPLYSIGLAWNVSKESFFNVPAIDDLKLRMTTGVNGNIDRSTSKVLTAIAGNSAPTGENYLTITFPENQNLRWESTRSSNFGLDVVALKNRLAVTLDYYVKKSYDLLGPVESDPSVGFSTVYKNTAAVRNTGFDIRVVGNILNGAFGWTSTLNYSYSKNEVTKVYTPTPNVDNYLTGGRKKEIEGKPIDYFYSYRWAGLNNQGNPQIYNDKGEKIADVNGNPPTLSWLEYSGTTVAPHFGSFINTFSWKGFSLTPMVTFQFGHVMRLPTSYLGTQGTLMSDVDLRWRKAGDEAFTDVPALFNSSAEPFARNQLYRMHNKRVTSASFVRLSNVSLTYDLPNKLTGRIFRNVQLQTQISNVAMWRKNDLDIDPEAIDRRDGDLFFAPTRSYSVGLKVDL